MKKRQKFWLFAAFVALVAGYALWDYQSTQKSAIEKDEKALLLPYNSGQISAIHFFSKAADFQLTKEKDGWKITKPIQEMADQTAVTSFANGLSTEKAIETAVESDKIDWATFGLDQPLGIISVTNNAGETMRFSVGNRKNFQGDAFLRIDGQNKILIVSSTWLEKAEKTLLEFRDKRLMKFSNAQTQKMIFEKGKEKFQLVKKEDTWILENQPDWKLDQNKVREILAMLNNTEALEIIAEGKGTPQEMKSWGLTSPRLKLTVQIKDQKDWTAEFAASSDKVHRVVTSEPVQVLKVSPTDSDKFFQISADSLRDRSEPFQFDKAQVQEIQIKSGDKTETVKVSDERGRQLLTKLRALAAVGLKEPKAQNLTNEILLKGEKGELLRLQWGNLHSVKINGGESQVYSAQTSVYPYPITILESDLADLKLNDQTKKEKSP